MRRKDKQIMKIKQFVLTCKESKEFRETGKTIHAYGGIGYVITSVDGVPSVTSLVPLAEVEYEIVVRR